MADKIILLDTSILIELFPKTDKTNSRFVKVAVEGFEFQISAITEYEIYSGATVSLSNGLPLATLNKKHFERIEHLK
jgi:predicted nucleic acid-binding protein